MIGQKRDGRREYDNEARDELVRLCLKPGVSIARTAMEHDINPKLLSGMRDTAAGTCEAALRIAARACVDAGFDVAGRDAMHGRLLNCSDNCAVCSAMSRSSRALTGFTC